MAENTAFDSLYAHGFARVAAVTLPVAIADPVTNASRIVAAARQAHARGVAVAVFPELALTGYAIDDLLLQDALLETVHAQIRRIAADSEGLTPVLVFGAPIRHRNRLDRVGQLRLVGGVVVLRRGLRLVWGAAHRRLLVASSIAV